jgi:hypothetical protein
MARKKLLLIVLSAFFICITAASATAHQEYVYVHSAGLLIPRYHQHEQAYPEQAPKFDLLKGITDTTQNIWNALCCAVDTVFGKECKAAQKTAPQPETASAQLTLAE